MFIRSVDPTGVVLSPFQGEVRLQSDFALARDPRTACTWQGFINQQASLQKAFSAAMEKLSLVGQQASKLVDCSDVVPQPPVLTPQQSQAVFPRGTTADQVQRACSSAAFPSLLTSTVPFTAVPVGYVYSYQVYRAIIFNCHSSCPLWWWSTVCPAGQQSLCCSQGK